MQNSYRKLLKTSRFPTLWCPGCGLGLIMRATAEVFAKLDFDHTNTTILSGIGCSGRTAGYFDIDSVHTTHGRVLPFAEAIKEVNPDLNVVVISGDGDLASIGGNHLLHAIRRNANITVVLINNELYGMTGGQLSPLTPQGNKTKTSPSGSDYPALDVQDLVLMNKKALYARSSVFHIDHYKKALEQALQFKNFRLVEARSTCLSHADQAKSYGGAVDMIKWQKENFKIVTNAKRLGDNELGIITKANDQ